MNDLLSALYGFAMEQGMATRFITDVAGYRSSQRMSGQAYDDLLPLLDQAAGKELDRFLDQRLNCEELERESIFTAGLSVGLTLARLG